MIWKYALASAVPAGALLVMYVLDREQLKAELAEAPRSTPQAPRETFTVPPEDRMHAARMEKERVAPRVEPTTVDVQEPAPTLSTDDVETNLQVFFDEQKPTPGASGASRSEVLDALRTADWPDVSIEQLDCRGAFCRLQSAKLKSEESRDYVARLTNPKSGWRGPIAVFPHGEGSDVTLEVYLGTPGSELPLSE